MTLGPPSSVSGFGYGALNPPNMLVWIGWFWARLPICRIGGGELGNFLYFVWTKLRRIHAFLLG